MTAVATPTSEAQARPPATTAAPLPARHHGNRPPAPLNLWAEVALAAVTMVTVAGLWRLFADGSFAVPLLANAAAAHAVTAVLRRRGISLVASGFAVAAAAMLAILWGRLWHTTFAGLPTTETFGVFGDQITESWRAFGEIDAPAVVLPGFVLALTVVVWVVAWLADLAAFRLWAPFEALIPAGTVFLFASIFGADDARLLAAALWLGAALAFVLVHRVARQQASPSWLGSDPREGSNAMLRNGALLGLIAVGLALVAGPRLPGHDAAPIIGPDAFDSGSSRQTVSPFIQISARLGEESDVEMFNVVAGAPRYWRLTSLDRFDGNTWSSSGSFERVDSDELGGLPEREDAAFVSQRFAITGLASIWLPAAFEPRQVSVEDGTEIRWEPESATLIVANSVPTSDGLIYEAVSALPVYDPAFLQAADGHVPRGVFQQGTALPADFPVSVVAEAQRVVAGATSNYDKALALQNYFRDGSFLYTESPPPATSTTAIESFLFETRAGFCQQFAGAYAAMARAVGLPARVAVGYTPGEDDPLEPGRYIVRGKYAHAWPEVYIAGVGWLEFEPTPNRGNPGAASYTGVPAQQAGDPAPGTEPGATPGTTILSGAPGTFPNPDLTPDPEGGQTPEGLDVPGTDEGATGDEGVDGRDILRFLGWIVLAGLVLVVLVLLAGASIAAWRALRRLTRRARAATAEDRVRVAWAEAVEAVEVLGVTPRRHETPLEFARRLGPVIDGAQRARPLAVVVEQADFALDGVTDEQAAQAAELSHGIRSSVHRQTTVGQRVLAAVDPRPPARRGRNRGPRPTGPRIQIRGELG